MKNYSLYEINDSGTDRVKQGFDLTRDHYSLSQSSGITSTFDKVHQDAFKQIEDKRWFDRDVISSDRKHLYTVVRLTLLGGKRLIRY